MSKKCQRRKYTKCVKAKPNKRTNRKRTNRKRTNKKRTRHIGAGACQGKNCMTKKEKEEHAAMMKRRMERAMRAERERRETEARQHAEQQLARERAAAYAKIEAEEPTYRKMQEDYDVALNEERAKSVKKGEIAFEQFHQKKDAMMDLWKRAVSNQRDLADRGVFMPFTQSLYEEREKDPHTAKLASFPLSRTGSLESDHSVDDFGSGIGFVWPFSW